MSDNLIDRLRGKYQVGTDGEFGTRDFSNFIPAVSLEAADEIQRLRDKLKNQCIECPLDRRYDDSGHPTFLRRQAD